jgi:hypothetical protein
MRGLARTLTAAAVALFATIAFTTDADARGGRGGGGAGGRGGPGGGGRGGPGGGRGGPGGPGAGGGRGGNNSAKRAGLNGKTVTDYLLEVMKEDAEGDRPEYLFLARDGSLVDRGADDRAAALRAQREEAAGERRGTTESGAHPL